MSNILQKPKFFDQDPDEIENILKKNSINEDKQKNVEKKKLEVKRKHRLNLERIRFPYKFVFASFLYFICITGFFVQSFYETGTLDNSTISKTNNEFFLLKIRAKTDLLLVYLSDNELGLKNLNFSIANTKTLFQNARNDLNNIFKILLDNKIYESQIVEDICQLAKVNDKGRCNNLYNGILLKGLNLFFIFMQSIIIFLFSMKCNPSFYFFLIK